MFTNWELNKCGTFWRPNSGWTGVIEILTPVEGQEETERLAKMAMAAPSMFEALEAFEKWEAELLNTDAAWSNGLPRFTQELYDKWMELQAKRNTALRKAEGRG